jgi:sugar lactone lactonase YvrE
LKPIHISICKRRGEKMRTWQYLVLILGIFLVPVFLLAASPDDSAIITTVAGNGTKGYNGDGGAAVSAELFNPIGIAFDSAGNLYIADDHNFRIRKVSPSGIITTVAGGGQMGFAGDGGAATSASLNQPHDVAVDSSGNLYIADSYNFRIRKVDSSGIITTVAGNGTEGFGGDGGAAISAELGYPGSIAVDSMGNLYIEEVLGDRRSNIRKVSTSGIISTVAGKGTTDGFSGDGGAAILAEFSYPYGVGLDSSGNLYIVDSGNNRIRKVNTSGVISTVAGGGTGGLGDGGPATSAELNSPVGIAFDSSGNFYFADDNNQLIRKVSTSGIISTVAGNGYFGFNGDNIPATSAMLASPTDVAIDTSGNLYFTDRLNQRVRKVH